MKKTPLILIAEDDVDAREMICRFLERRGFQTICASDGAETVKLIIKHHPTLIIMDIMMPEVNGVDVLKTIRENVPKEKWKPIIITTGLPMFYGEKYFDENFDIHISKPCLMSEVLTAINKVIEHHRSTINH